MYFGFNHFPVLSDWCHLQNMLSIILSSAIAKEIIYLNKQHKILLPVVFSASFAQWWALELYNIETSRFILLWIIGLILLYKFENNVSYLYLPLVNMHTYTCALYLVTLGHLKNECLCVWIYKYHANISKNKNRTLTTGIKTTTLFLSYP